MAIRLFSIYFVAMKNVNNLKLSPMLLIAESQSCLDCVCEERSSVIESKVGQFRWNITPLFIDVSRSLRTAFCTTESGTDGLVRISK
ncbi:hypothetical protein TNCV_2018461 [Trichonephila clavipes]|nr:hypothetical protein TNCV_2018461 [Trichonephila clavipes]